MTDDEYEYNSGYKDGYNVGYEDARKDLQQEISEAWEAGCKSGIFEKTNEFENIKYNYEYYIKELLEIIKDQKSILYNTRIECAKLSRIVGKNN